MLKKPVLVTAGPPALTAPTPVLGRADTAQALGNSVSYVDKLRLAGKARPSIPYGATGRFVFRAMTCVRSRI